jgi:hypothetical protein
MRLWDAAGYLASGLVITAFCMKGIIALRAVALISNVAFLVYGIGLDLVPVWLLHLILLPVNSWRLWQGVSCGCTAMVKKGDASLPRDRLCVREGLLEVRRDRPSARQPTG